MVDEQAAAEALFGGTTKAAQAPASKPAETADSTLAAALYRPKGDTYKPVFDQSEQPKLSPEQAKPGEQQPKPDQAKPTETQIAEQATQIAKTLAKEAGLAADDPSTVSFSKLASEIGISPEHATKLAAWDAERNEKAWNDQFDAWSEATNKEFVSADLDAARQVVFAYGDAELQDLLEGPLGLGSNPAVVRLMVNIARGRRTR